MQLKYSISLFILIAAVLCGYHLLTQSRIGSFDAPPFDDPNKAVQAADKAPSSTPFRSVQAKDPCSPLAAGMQEAEAAIKAGQLGYKRLGLRNGNINTFGRILKEDYGITLYDVASCAVSPDIRDNAEGYNLVMEEEFYDRFGKDVIREVRSKVAKIAMKSIRDFEQWQRIEATSNK